MWNLSDKREIYIERKVMMLAALFCSGPTYWQIKGKEWDQISSTVLGFRNPCAEIWKSPDINNRLIQVMRKVVRK
jgi:hypothetical protein